MTTFKKNKYPVRETNGKYKILRYLSFSEFQKWKRTVLANTVMDI